MNFCPICGLEIARSDVWGFVQSQIIVMLQNNAFERRCTLYLFSIYAAVNPYFID